MFVQYKIFVGRAVIKLRENPNTSVFHMQTWWWVWFPGLWIANIIHSLLKALEPNSASIFISAKISSFAVTALPSKNAKIWTAWTFPAILYIFAIIIAILLYCHSDQLSMLQYSCIMTSYTDEKYLYRCPDRLRLPLIFYLPHPSSMYINKLMLAGLLTVREKTVHDI